MNLVTLTTDFGVQSMYAAAMKGALFTVNPNVLVIDLSHAIPPQNLVYTNYFLHATIPYYPKSTLHVVVVDPGVGSERRILFVDMGDYQLLVPDNGCWTSLLEHGVKPARVIQVTETKYFRDRISNTFHGRDIFAPVAGHLSAGVDPQLLGEQVHDWIELALPHAVCTDQELRGEVIFVDDFGNLLTNIPADPFLEWHDKPLETTIGTTTIEKRVSHYADAAFGEPAVLVSSMNRVEIGVNQGNAAKQLHADVGTPVQIKRR